jgi:uncharacterized protein (TIGR02996 family)
MDPRNSAEARLLLDAILAAPEDDAPRLVYADWLLAGGDRLGELIVAQLQQARAPDDVELARRAAALVSAHRSEVIGDLSVSKPVFRRGFVEAAEISASDLPRVSDELFVRLPLLTELVIWLERERATAKLCGSPLFARLRRLGLRYGRGMPLDALAQNPGLGGLEHLELTSCGVDAPGCEVLAQSPHLGSLRSLELGSDRIGAAGLTKLAEAPWAPNLRRLRLWKAELGRASTTPLAAFTALETLELGFDDLDVPAVAALAPLAPTLRALSLRGDRLGAAVVPALASLTPTLTHLDLEGMRIGDTGAAALAKLELGALETLILSGNALTTAGVRGLLGASLPRLRRLVLRHNELDRGARLFARNLTDTRVELDETVLPPGR